MISNETLSCTHLKCQCNSIMCPAIYISHFTGGFQIRSSLMLILSYCEVILNRRNNVDKIFLVDSIYMRMGTMFLNDCQQTIKPISLLSLFMPSIWFARGRSPHRTQIAHYYGEYHWKRCFSYVIDTFHVYRGHQREGRGCMGRDKHGWLLLFVQLWFILLNNRGKQK